MQEEFRIGLAWTVLQQLWHSPPCMSALMEISMPNCIHS